MSRRAGSVLQGLVLGLLLVIGIVALWSSVTGAAVFRYQGF